MDTSGKGQNMNNMRVEFMPKNSAVWHANVVFYGQFGINYNNSRGPIESSALRCKLVWTLWGLHNTDNTVQTNRLKLSIHTYFPKESDGCLWIKDGQKSIVSIGVHYSEF